MAAGRTDVEAVGVGLVSTERDRNRKPSYALQMRHPDATHGLSLHSRDDSSLPACEATLEITPGYEFRKAVKIGFPKPVELHSRRGRYQLDTGAHRSVHEIAPHGNDLVGCKSCQPTEPNAAPAQGDPSSPRGSEGSGDERSAAPAEELRVRPLVSDWLEISRAAEWTAQRPSHSIERLYPRIAARTRD